jgi:hypothetical protein
MLVGYMHELLTAAMARAEGRLEHLHHKFFAWCLISECPHVQVWMQRSTTRAHREKQIERGEVRHLDLIGKPNVRSKWPKLSACSAAACASGRARNM